MDFGFGDERDTVEGCSFNREGVIEQIPDYNRYVSGTTALVVGGVVALSLFCICRSKAPMMRALRISCILWVSVLLNFADILTDLWFLYSNIENDLWWAGWTFGFFIVSTIWSAVSEIYTERNWNGLKHAILSLLQLNIAYHAATIQNIRCGTGSWDRASEEDTKIQTLTWNFRALKSFECTFESLPQILLQLYIWMISTETEINKILFISLPISILSATYTLATSDDEITICELLYWFFEITSRVTAIAVFMMAFKAPGIAAVVVIALIRFIYLKKIMKEKDKELKDKAAIGRKVENVFKYLRNNDPDAVKGNDAEMNEVIAYLGTLTPEELVQLEYNLPKLKEEIKSEKRSWKFWKETLLLMSWMVDGFMSYLGETWILPSRKRWMILQLINGLEIAALLALAHFFGVYQPCHQIIFIWGVIAISFILKCIVLEVQHRLLKRSIQQKLLEMLLAKSLVELAMNKRSLVHQQQTFV